MRHSRRQPTQNVPNGNSHPSNRRPPAALAGLDCDDVLVVPAQLVIYTLFVSVVPVGLASAHILLHQCDLVLAGIRNVCHERRSEAIERREQNRLNI